MCTNIDLPVLVSGGDLS